MDQISKYASSLATQMESWAQSTFAQTSQITSQAVGNFFNVSQNMLGLSNNLTGQYNNLFAPENAQLVADANSYASPARMATDMGMAGATQAQAGKAALDSSEEALRSFGIDPSSGRYAALDQASKVQNAANVAGAENMQQRADVATGQQLRAEAVNVGAQLPAAIANVNNTAIQANTGASNAELANANTGANLFKLPNDFLQTAMSLKLPPSASQSTGQSSSNSSKPNNPSGGGGGNGGGGNGAGGGSSGAAWMPSHGGVPEMLNAPPGAPQPGSMPEPPGGGQTFDPNGMGSVGVPDPNGGTPGVYDPNGLGGNGVIDENPLGNGGFGQGLPNDGGWSGGADQTFGGLGSPVDQNAGLGNTGYDPNSNPMGDTSGLQGGSWTDPSPPPSDPGVWGDNSGGDSSGGFSDFARGGAVMMRHLSNHYKAPMMADGGATTGGMVPRQASPSMGQKTDDVPANLNANEFVIPRDVALWKGQEFFQKLISDSRKTRLTASPAQGTPPQPGKPNPAMTQPPRFVSRPMR